MISPKQDKLPAHHKVWLGKFKKKKKKVLGPKTVPGGFNQLCKRPGDTQITGSFTEGGKVSSSANRQSQASVPGLSIPGPLQQVGLGA